MSTLMSQEFPRLSGECQPYKIQSALPLNKSVSGDEVIDLSTKQGFSGQTNAEFQDPSLDNCPPLQHEYKPRLAAARNGTFKESVYGELEKTRSPSWAPEKTEKKETMQKLRKRILEKRPDLKTYLKYLLQRPSDMGEQGRNVYTEITSYALYGRRLPPKLTKKVRLGIRKTELADKPSHEIILNLPHGHINPQNVNVYSLKERKGKPKGCTELV